MSKTAIPVAPDELSELLQDGDKVLNLIKEGNFEGLVKQYAKNVADRDHEISEQIKGQVEVGLQEFLKENRAEFVNATRPSPNVHDSRSLSAQDRKQSFFNKAALGAQVDGEFDSLGQFMRAVSGKARNFRDGKDLVARREKLQEIQNSFGTNAPDDGGYLVPEEFRSQILQLALETSVIRPRATVIPMSTQRALIPTVDSTSNATTVYGGWQAYWVDEGTAPTETSAKFGQVVLDTKKLMLYSTAPNELVADGVGFDAWLRQSLPKVLSFEEDYRFMVGSGAGEPLGFVNCPASVAVTAQAGQGANTIVMENLANMFARMLPSSLSTAVWLASIDTFPQLATMALSVGTGGGPVWLANGGIADAPPMTIYGRPVIFTEKLSTLGTTGDIAFVDLSYYLVGDRQSISVSESQDFLFSTDKTAYKVIERVDGRPWLQSAITPKNGSSNTLTPFVQLSSTRT
jgi:HK97 family phage major capsid protein